MFRKTTITMSLAAAAFVAIGSSAPADAHAIDCWLEPTHCIVDLVTPDRDRGPVEEDTTLDPGTVAGVVNIDLGGLFFPEPEDSSLTPGGVVTDIGPGIVLTPALPDGVLDDITGPVVELPEVELPPLEIPGDDDTDTPVEPATPEAPEPAGSPDEGRTVSTTPASPSGDASEAATSEASPTTTVAAQDEPTDSQTDESIEAILNTDAVTDASSSFDPAMAALLGMLGALALTLTVFAAFKAGRRRS
jgi:hypothetical protein